jgi:predicted RNA-binding Zn-ribbon protein involved in translation (DUF1610 family)
MGRPPYCSNCGYSLIGLTESSKCPECGRPLVEVLTRDPIAFRTGKRYKSQATLFGRPLVHVAIGPYEDEPRGIARGIIAIGDVANGWLAIGGAAYGIIAIGGMAVGVAAIGGMALGLLALGGFAVGGYALGGGAVGFIASGGAAIGVIAQGGGAVGYIARGGGVFARHGVPLAMSGGDPLALAFFTRWSWLLGTAGPGYASLLIPLMWWMIAAVAVALASGAAVSAALFLRQRSESPTGAGDSRM